MQNRSAFPLLFTAAALLLAGASVSLPALAQSPPTINAPQAECVPADDNGLINATVTPEVGGATTRLYFRWDEHGAMYYVDMVAAGGGNYWGIPPKPEPRNENLQYYVASVDAYGRTLARSESMTTPVKESCPVELSPKQVGVANNLVIGETVPAQEGNRVLGFLCDGIVSRINPEGIMRPDEICRGCVIPWWAKEDYIIPAAVIPAAGFLVCCSGSKEEASPSRP